MILGLENDRALNQAFFITDGERVSWGDFIRAHMALLKPPPEVREIWHVGTALRRLPVDGRVVAAAGRENIGVNRRQRFGG